MKSIVEFINEQLDVEFISEGKVTDEKSFREMAEAKFKKAFGDDLDEDKMKKTIDGILSKHKAEADKGDWGTLIGVLNKAF